MKILIPSPNFRCKNNGKIISKEVEQLKFYVRERYKHKVENYFHDIIIHIGDNFCHSEQSSSLLD